MKNLSVFALIGVLATSTAAQANLISNGDLSANAAAYSTDPGYDALGTNPAQPTSWNINSNNQQGVNGPDTTWIPGDANDVFGPADPTGVRDFLFLQNQPGSYTFGGQSVALAASTTYKLDFDYAGRRGDAPGFLGLVISDGSGNFFDTRNATDINVSTAAWQHETLTFTTTANANGGGSVIFTNEATAHGQPFDVTVDVSNVVLNVVPEPASVVLFGLGAVGLFIAARRRK